jgi:predicted ester cyclase
LDEAKSRFDQIRRDNPTFRSTIEDIIAEGDKVAVRLTWYMGEKPYSLYLFIVSSQVYGIIEWDR